MHSRLIRVLSQEHSTFVYFKYSILREILSSRKGWAIASYRLTPAYDSLLVSGGEDGSHPPLDCLEMRHLVRVDAGATHPAPT